MNCLIRNKKFTDIKENNYRSSSVLGSIIGKGFLLFLLFTARPSYSQEIQTRFSADYDNAPFSVFINDLEKQCNVRVFYINILPDSIKLSFSFSKMHLDSVLYFVNRETGLNYFVSEERDIILSKYFSIKSDFSYRYEQTMNTSDVKVVPVKEEIITEREEIKIQQRTGTNSYFIGRPGESREEKHRLSGYIKNEKNGEPLIGAAIYCENLKSGVITDEQGHYTISLPSGANALAIMSIGMKKTFLKVTIYANGELNIEVPEDVTTLNEVIVLGDRTDNLKTVQMGANLLSSKTIKMIPVGMGEADVLKSLLLLPGVQVVGEGASGFNVRGGNTDQNLILLDDAPIYNTSHFFGFFSSVNNDALRDVKLYKSGIPAKYGGRISSVLNMNVKEGNKKEFDFNGGISPIAARLTLEGPLIKDKISFIISGRSTYTNWILKKIPDPRISNSQASFYDITSKLQYNVNSNNNISVTGYYSHDNFKFQEGESYGYSNKASTVRWKHIFSPNISYTLTGVYSDYSYVIDNNESNSNFTTRFGIQDFGIKNDFTFTSYKKHKIETGFHLDKTNLYPASRRPLTETSPAIPKIMETEHSIQPVYYINDTWDPFEKLSISAGLRYSGFIIHGPKTIFTYIPDQPKIDANINDTISISNNEIIKSYQGLDYRFSGRFSINKNVSLKASYSRIYQYFFILSNSTTISPTDIWKSSDYHLSPEAGNQYSLGLYWNTEKNKLNFSVEGYYKTIQNQIDYKSGANLLLNEHIETDLINTTGKSYGIEFLAEKTAGKFNGWISYTYSRSLSRSTGKFKDEIINGGNYFPSNYDKPHSFSIVSNYSFTRRVTISGDCTYSSGRPITYPVAYYQIEGIYRVLYDDRNKYRIPDYFRIDLSIIVEGNLKIKKPVHGSWVFSVYNLLGRDNVYSEFFRTDKSNLVHSYRLSVFNRPIFTVTYNFKYYSL